MHGLWGMGQMIPPCGTKYIIVVEDDVEVHNTSEVLFRLCANTDPQRDSFFIPQLRDPSDVLDHATKKLPGKGFKRVWPPLIKMDEQVRSKLDELFGGIR